MFQPRAATIGMKSVGVILSTGSSMMVEAEVVHGSGATGARDIANDDVRPARHVFRKVTLIDPRFGVGIASRRIVDEERQRLVFVELRRGRRGRQHRNCDNDEKTLQHGYLQGFSYRSPDGADRTRLRV